MKITRSIEPETEAFQVGDVIIFELKDGEDVQAMAMKQTAEGMIFCLVDCLSDEETMRELPDKLNTAILDRFPAEIRGLLKPFADGRFLRLPTEKEVWGVNKFGADEGPDVEQWEPMKKCRNRVAFQGLDGKWEWWWTETPHKNYPVDFTYVYVYADGSGDGGCDGAGESGGVRPAFLI